MFSKLISLCALVAAASAQDMPAVETKDGNVIFIAPSKASFVREKAHVVSDSDLIDSTDDLEAQVNGQAAAVEDVVAAGASTQDSADKITAAEGSMAQVGRIGD